MENNSKNNKTDEIFGYKAFNKDLTNRYNIQFEVGKTYQMKGEIIWGNHGNGFHMCTHLEDCFRFFPHQEVTIAYVKGFGEKICYDDEYYGYYDMYVCEKLEIIRVLNRKEIIDKILCITDKKNLEKFLSTVILTEDEIRLFKEHYNNRFDILDSIAYYQEGQTYIYSKKGKSK